ncbi:MAG TPA: phage terminase large subunit family protein [Rhodocyclaceae bacterium]|nr:phage terminase large subunit family protein [Rhodocyclaceae bacterium]
MGAAEHLGEWADAALESMLRRVFAELRPRRRMSLIEWSERFRVLSPEESPDHAGRYRLEHTPALRGILAALSQKGVRRVVVQKSAQIGYTAGVVCNLLGYHVHWRPRGQVVMFPRLQSAKDFDAEKFSPMVTATRVLSRRIRLKSRSDGNSATRKRYPGGFIKFVASNSPSDVKSTTAAVLIVEEPDDTNKDVRGQGRSMTLLRERGKTVTDVVELIGGTPTAKGASEIEAEMRTTDQRRFLITCPHCGEQHEPHWRNVVIPGFELSDADLRAPDLDTRHPQREVYGRARWEAAFYTCPHNGCVLTDDERIEAIRIAASVPPLYGWVPTADARDPGFYPNEMLSVFDGSRVPVLAEKFLRAHDALERGDPSEMVAFHNASRGEPWEYKGELPEEEELANRAEDYAEWSVPVGGIEPVMTIDVQHDRLAVTVWVFGRGDEMWLAYWGELYGSTIVPHQGAWIELEQMLATARVHHVTGAELPIAAAGIDAGDGQTSDAVYAFCRKHHRLDRQVLALKGASDSEGRVEIWTPPRPVDPNARSTKASRWGIQVHLVGTAKAKDLILGWATEGGRVRLTGAGPGRMHWYKGVRADFFEQLLGEMKVPSRSNPNKRFWKERTDRRHEALDCTVYAVYLGRHLRLHLRRSAQWDLAELMLRQRSLLPSPSVDTVQTSAPPAPAPAAAAASPKPAAPSHAPQPAPAADPENAFASLVRARRNGRRR